MMRVPTELIVMIAILAVLAAVCTWAIRADWRHPDGRINWWVLTEAFVGLFVMRAFGSWLARRHPQPELAPT